MLEIEALDKLKSGGFLEPLVFTGGTMLRLCYELNRYSTDLDFWFVKKRDAGRYFTSLKKYLAASYELTDAHVKFRTILFELRSPGYPKRLKIEIRKDIKPCDFQERIAFSNYSTKQVMLRAHTLEQAMKNKIAAALDRKDIRDYFDMEFLARRGVEIKADAGDLPKLRKIAMSFKDKDYKVTLGAVLDAETRRYYAANGFKYLIEKLTA